MSKSVVELIKEQRKRKGWSQTVLGDLVGMSAATIHRIEHGEKIPTDPEARMIADSLGITYELMIEACQSARENQTPISKSAYKLEWQASHPSTYAGPVWIQITPKTENYRERHHFSLRWGVWEREGSFVLENGQANVFLSHYKHNDGLGLPLFLKLSHPCYVVFGREDIEDKMLDINFKWRRVEPPEPKQLWFYTKHYLNWFFKRIFSKK